VEKKWTKTTGHGRGQQWTLISQVSLFSGENGTLLQQYTIGMRKVSGFNVFAIKSHRVHTFSKKCPEGPTRENVGLIPEYQGVLCMSHVFQDFCILLDPELI
jgi:hypothetical protein